MSLRAVLAILAISTAAGGCVGTVIGATTDAAIEVVKIPFKVGAAVVDVATGDDERKSDDDDE